MLEVVGLVDLDGVRFVVLQLRGSTREWWQSYMISKPAGSPLVEQNMFSEVFNERFIPRVLERRVGLDLRL